MDGHATLRACIASLIRRLETILETNPEIHLDDDIRLARKALDDHWAEIERLMGRLKNLVGLPVGPSSSENNTGNRRKK